MNMPLRPAVPRLEPGDRLTRDEFERRYHAMPHLKKAELIEGVVHMPSPVRWGHHGSPHVSLVWVFGYYRAFTPGVDAADNATVRLDDDNEPQPDATLIVRPGYGGRATISADDYLEGAPELVAEVAASSAAIDLKAKFDVYQRNGVSEYLIWRVGDGELDWFRLADGYYRRIVPDDADVIRSLVFPGLWLDAAALLRDDQAAVLATLTRGVSSPDHAAFVQRLAARRSS